MRKHTFICHLCTAALLLAGAAACTQTGDEEAILRDSSSTKVIEYYTVTVNLEAAGTLSAALGDEASSVEKLVVTGPFNGDDVSTMRALPRLESIDMSGATIVGGGTYTSVNEYGSEHEYSLEDNVIGESMFAALHLSEIVLPESITGIGSSAFAYIEGYSALEMVIPEGVTSIGESTFYGCPTLVSVQLPSSLQEIPSGCFYDCERLHTVNLGEGITRIGSAAFSGCINLRSIDLPESLESLEEACFAGTGLISMELPASVRHLGDGCFSESSLVSIVINEGIQWTTNEEGHYFDGIFYHCEALESVILPNDMPFIPSGMFYECTSLTAITIPEGVTSIYGNAFYRCSALQSIELPEGLTEIGVGAFAYCSSLASIHLPSTLRSLGSGVFGYCHSLAEVNLPEGFLELPAQLFLACSSLTQITLPSSLRSLGSSCFSSAGLTHIELPERLSSIEDDCFAGCPLQSITIHENVSLLGETVFSDCLELTSIFWESDIDVPDLGVSSPNCLLYTSSESLQVNDPTLRNVVRNGVAETFVIEQPRSDVYEWYSFNVPQAFTAKEIRYAHYFDGSYTEPGSSRGWNTIALPFAPTSITTEDGRVLAPFNADVADAKPFWLRRLTEEGFQNVTQIEAGVPYIIAMPNNPGYLPEYNISGCVIFSASDEAGIPIPVTSTQTVTDHGPEYSLTSSLSGLLSYSMPDVYVLNIGGSYFERKGDYNLAAFSCYAIPNGSARPTSLAIDAGRASTRSAHVPGPVPSIDDM